MNTPNTLRCVFVTTTRSARTCLRRQFNSSVRLYQRADDPPQEKSVKDGGKNNSDGDSHSTMSREGYRRNFCPNCGQRGHRRSECNNVSASKEEKQQIKEAFFGESFKSWRGPKESKRTLLPPAPAGKVHVTAQEAAVLKGLKPYSEKDRTKLKKMYTPAQFAALEAGEAAVDPNDIAQQASLHRFISINKRKGYSFSIK